MTENDLPDWDDPLSTSQADLKRTVRLNRRQCLDMFKSHSTSGPHERGGHEIVNDWDLKLHYCLGCGRASRSKKRIETTDCDGFRAVLGGPEP